jgi:adenylosuccinate synthase
VAYHTTAAAAPADSGLPPLKLNVIGICKAYTTRVGNGPFPTEQTNPIGDHLQSQGHEFGTVSGRKRRCGWLDLTLVKNAVELNGVKTLALTKLDVLGGLEKIKVATGYMLKGKKLTYPPVGEKEFNQAKPVYREFSGWEQDISSVRKFNRLPAGCRKYIKFIENFLKVPVQFISVGPERNQTIVMS